MMTPADWNEALRPDRDLMERRKVLANAVRTFLCGGGNLGDDISTTDLVEALFPARYAKGSDVSTATRKFMFDALNKRVLGKYALRDCMSLATAKRKWGKTAHPARWHAPRPTRYCQACGQELPETL